MTESSPDSIAPALAPTAAPVAMSRRGVLLVGALAGASALLLPRLPAHALKLGTPSNLKFLENVQFLQNQFFTRALMARSLGDLTAQNIAVINTIAREDGEQARWFRLARARGGLMPVRGTQPSSLTEPTFTINAATYSSRARFLDSAIAIKSAAVGAYHGIVGAGGDGEIVQALAALAGVQNRHLAMLNDMAGKDPFVTYVKATSLQEAAKTLGKFGFGTEVA